MFSWILSPLVQYAMFAAGLLLCLYLFCSAKAELRSLQKRGAENQRRLEETVRVLDERSQQAPALPPARSSIDLTSRAQALRMHRRGEPAASIAAALGLPRNEVELMLKVHRLLAAE